jgi:hypothetical protein
MIYLAPNAGKAGMPKCFGVMTSPSHGGVPRRIRQGSLWAADNQVFTCGFHADRFFSWLDCLRPYRQRCLFVTVPDVVANAIATLESFKWWAWRFKALGWPVAFVAQDGQEDLPFPPEFDWLFIGGSTEWKLSDAADECIRRAQRLERRVHIGRINSLSRYRHFALIGADSCDGTTICFEPDEGIRKFSMAMRWQVMPLMAENGD